MEVLQLAQPEDPELSIGRPIAFHSQGAPPPPPDRLHPGQPNSARPCIGRPIASQSPKDENDHSKQLEFPIGERRWYVVSYSESISHESKMIAEEVTRTLRQKVRKRVPHIEPNFTAEAWLEQLKWRSSRVRFETCWLMNDDDTPGYIRAIQGHSQLEADCEP